jgi:hypothetical protein
MRKTKPRAFPSVDIMEPRLMLSTAAPLLSRHALAVVTHEIKAIVTTLARTQNTVQAGTNLKTLTAQLPSATGTLNSAWQSDLGFYHPHSVRSVVTTQNRILTDLYRYDYAYNSEGESPQPGSGASGPSNPGQGAGGSGSGSSAPGTGPGQGMTNPPNPPPPAPSLDSVNIQNTTGLAIQVTVFLETGQAQEPTITRIIPASGNTTANFDFGSSTGDFMMMNVSRYNGGDSPPPFDNANLSQPLNGYNGITFTISLFGAYFTVNVPT